MATSDDVGEFVHVPVLLDKVLAAFDAVPPGLVIDGTLGGGGHAAALLDRRTDIALLGLDRDPAAIQAATHRLGRYGERVTIVRARFDSLASLGRGEADARGVPVVGVLLDLGVSSPQLDEGTRGFSYRQAAPLDMRMDTDQTLTADAIVNSYDEATLTDVLERNADERFARRIAKAIVAARPVETTTALADLVRDAIPAPARRRGGHPAKRTFQAIRIEVNGELDLLDATLTAAIDVTDPGGRLAVISYHSGEDRRVKAAFREAVDGGCICPPGLPCVCGAQPTARTVGRQGLRPDSGEVARNPRAESARLRVIQKLEPPATAKED